MGGGGWIVVIDKYYSQNYMKELDMQLFKLCLYIFSSLTFIVILIIRSKQNFHCVAKDNVNVSAKVILKHDQQ